LLIYLTGNHDRGWNDPPQFLYDAQASGAATNLSALNKRVGHDLSTTTPATGPTSATVSDKPGTTDLYSWFFCMMVHRYSGAAGLDTHQLPLRMEHHERLNINAPPLNEASFCLELKLM